MLQFSIDGVVIVFSILGVTRASDWSDRSSNSSSPSTARNAGKHYYFRQSA